MSLADGQKFNETLIPIAKGDVLPERKCLQGLRDNPSSV